MRKVMVALSSASSSAIRAAVFSPPFVVARLPVASILTKSHGKLFYTFPSGQQPDSPPTPHSVSLTQARPAAPHDALTFLMPPSPTTTWNTSARAQGTAPLTPNARAPSRPSRPDHSDIEIVQPLTVKPRPQLSRPRHHG
ncbi:hypothetical protein FB45DRAFT_943097, partial [Roridomyces roridus]